MSELVAKLYGQCSAGLLITANQLVRAWCAATDPEQELPPSWWVARFREALPERTTWYPTRLYRAATATEIDEGFLGIQWTTERADAEAEARKWLRVLVETVVSPGAILAVIGTECGGTALVDSWQVKTIYLSEDVRENRPSVHGAAHSDEEPSQDDRSGDWAHRRRSKLPPKRKQAGWEFTAGMSDGAQTKRGDDNHDQHTPAGA
ncbi:MAG: hypothetical protein Q3976_07835 [Corynebacterium sp.]|nr:hypothetical protein [Corynebacterium sp.]